MVRVAAYSTEWRVLSVEEFIWERIIRVQRNYLQRFTTTGASSGNELGSKSGAKV